MVAERRRTTQAALKEIEVLIRARYPVIYIVTWEEQRVQGWLMELARTRKKKAFEWSFCTGIMQAGTSIQSQRTRTAKTKDPLCALDQVLDEVGPALYIFKDLHPFLTRNNVAVMRRLKEIAVELKNSYKTIVLISPVLELPSELEKEVTVVDFPLPGVEDLSTLLDRIVDEVKDQPELTVDLADEAREELLKAALGLTVSEAENVFAKILVGSGHLDKSNIGIVFSEKQQIVRKSGLLEYYESDVRMQHVGGLEHLKEWLKKRALAFSDRARKFGLAVPKGLFLLGAQGCGKSLSAKAVSSMWRMPLLRLDVGRVFGSLVGSSEENMRRAISVAESVAPVILWIDEIDKAMAGMRSSGSGDSGTTARVLGTFLTWLAEKQSSVFVIATANSVRDLPPEFVRKGRFDEIFFVDLPTTAERREIFGIHLAKRGRDPQRFDTDALSHSAVGFSGAEIEEAINSALYDAFSEKKHLATEHVAKALKETVPLSRTMENEFSQLRGWAEGRARFASPTEVQMVETRRRLEI
ncbi:AAA family ATPase [Planctomycetota bacterium]